jgi:hypothetical protein
MIGHKLFVRFVGALTCVAAVAAGLDAEAACWHRRRACCTYQVSCCDPCSTPVCTTSCAPACSTVCEPTYERVCVTYRDPCTNCCSQSCSYRVVNECCVAAAPVCCEGVIVAAANRPTESVMVGTARPAVKTVASKR